MYTVNKEIAQINEAVSNLIRSSDEYVLEAEHKTDPNELKCLVHKSAPHKRAANEKKVLWQKKKKILIQKKDDAGCLFLSKATQLCAGKKAISQEASPPGKKN